MAREPFLVSFRQDRWAVTHGKQQCGSFRFRTNALKAAIEASHWQAARSERADVFIHDRDGAVYTAWCPDRDSLLLTV